MAKLWGLTFLLIFSSCSTLKPGLEIEGAGGVKENLELEQKAYQIDNDKGVHFFFGITPKGIKISADKKTLEISQKYQEKFELLGAVKADYTAKE
ncbi:MAG: hypothetical protein ACPGJV_15340, partial [Bacteriovoracaceae bacterium]